MPLHHDHSGTHPVDRVETVDTQHNAPETECRPRVTEDRGCSPRAITRHMTLDFLPGVLCCLAQTGNSARTKSGRGANALELGDCTLGTVSDTAPEGRRWATSVKRG